MSPRARVRPICKGTCHAILRDKGESFLTQQIYIYKVLRKLSLYPMVFTQYGKIITNIKHVSMVSTWKRKLLYVYTKIVDSKAKYKIYFQKDDIGIKLKFQCLNSLIIPSWVIKLWMHVPAQPRGRGGLLHIGSLVTWLSCACVSKVGCVCVSFFLIFILRVATNYWFCIGCDQSLMQSNSF